MDDPCELTLILPAYNEEAGIAQAIAEADDALLRLGVPYEILVVDDGSRDHTAAIVEVAMKARPRVRIARHGVNRGYGAALRTGFEAARGRLIAFTDADCQFHLDDLAPLLLLTERHPIAVGYRVDRKDSWLRKVYSRGYNLLVRVLLGSTVRDIDCALKVFHRDALEKILPESQGFFVNTEILTKARLQGLSIAEVGVRHRPRRQGDSKVSIFDIPRVLKVLLPFWWAHLKWSQRVAVGAMSCAMLLGMTLVVADPLRRDVDWEYEQEDDVPVLMYPSEGDHASQAETDELFRVLRTHPHAKLRIRTASAVADIWQRLPKELEMEILGHDRNDVTVASIRLRKP